MVSKELQIKYEKGIHARPAAIIVETTKKFTCEISFIKDDVRVNAKSIMNILLLAIEPGTKILVEAEGPDEQDALEAVSKLFEDKFYNEIHG